MRYTLEVEGKPFASSSNLAELLLMAERAGGVIVDAENGRRYAHKRSERVLLTMTPADRALAKEHAKRAGVAMSRWVTDAIRARALIEDSRR